MGNFQLSHLSLGETEQKFPITWVRNPLYLLLQVKCMFKCHLWNKCETCYGSKFKHGICVHQGFTCPSHLQVKRLCPSELLYFYRGNCWISQNLTRKTAFGFPVLVLKPTMVLLHKRGIQIVVHYCGKEGSPDNKKTFQSCIIVASNDSQVLGTSLQNQAHKEI